MFATARRVLEATPPHKGLLVLDIDGTCVDSFAAPRVRELKGHAQRHGARVVFLTARHEAARPETMAELRQHGIWARGDKLYMTGSDAEWRDPGPFKWRVRSMLRPSYTTVVNVGDQPYDHAGVTPGFTHAIVIDNERRQTGWLAV